MAETRCDDCGSALGEIEVRVSDGSPVCLDCFQTSQPKSSPVSRQQFSHRPDNGSEVKDAAYWRGMYQVMFRILCEQYDDPALKWIDEIVHTRFSKLL